MGRSLIWSEEAIKTISIIYRHVSQQTKSKQIALQLISRIQRSAATLLVFPQAGAVEPLLEDNPKCYRSLVAEKHYKIIYSLKNENHIEIAAVWDCHQDPDRLRQTL